MVRFSPPNKPVEMVVPENQRFSVITTFHFSCRKVLRDGIVTLIKRVQENLFPHLPQNFAPDLIGFPQAVQTEDDEETVVIGAAGAGALTEAPQLLQNFLPGAIGLPQLKQTVGKVSGLSRGRTTVPQFPQNFMPGCSGCRHVGQVSV
jgi:hypothetical protein